MPTTPPEHLTGKDLARPLAEVVRAAGLSRSQVADALGVSPATAARKLAGHAPLRVSDLLALADLVGVRPSELLPVVMGAEHV